MPVTAIATTAPDTTSQSRPRRIRSGPLLRNQARKRPFPVNPLHCGCRCSAERRTAHSVNTRATTSAEIIEASTPMDRVTPKPRTGPEARKNSRPAASNVVTFESRMALQARLNPARSAVGSAVGAEAARSAYSSLARSNTSTLASIASPIASTKPARPGSVRVAPSATSAAYAISA
jgi:hypothetical protein